MAFTIYTVYNQIFKIWRKKRFLLFLKALSPSQSDTMLDVGGYPQFWNSHPPVVSRIDCLNLHPMDYVSSTHPLHNIHTVVGNGCYLDFLDHSYDIAYSNSVIEHVSTWENQKAFAKELTRVGQRLWCQTPALECPIEPHYLAPFVHWFSPEFRRKILRYFTPWGIISRPSKERLDFMVKNTRLISKKEMIELFPDCDIYIERLLFIFPKSYVAISRPNGLITERN